MTDVRIGAGLLDDPDLLPPRTQRTKVAIVAQPQVVSVAESLAAIFSQSGLRAEVRELPDGESAKTLQVAADAYEWLNQLGLNRYDTLVAVGGGAATDLGGFVGATYLRGIETIYCPTTLLGAVDASIGGKTGVNVAGKNLVGVFADPAQVIIDLDLLGSLSEDLLKDGFAEALKAGLIADVELVELIEAHGTQAPLEDVVRRAVAVKQSTVTQDFHEKGIRMILNYGHTIGHALEIACKVTHGEAVSIGMIAAGAISENEVGFPSLRRQRAAITRLGLPVIAPDGTSRNEVERLIAMDKKRDKSGLRMVLLKEVGSPVVLHVSDESIAAGLTAIGVA